MTDYANYEVWMADGGWIRVSARTLIFSQDEKALLIEQVQGNEWCNFIGGGVEVGESLQETIARELAEETDAVIRRTAYCFVVENFFKRQGRSLHSLEFYFRVWLEQDNLRPKSHGVLFLWTPLQQLATLDLRPSIVRDAVADGSYATIGHLLLNV